MSTRIVRRALVLVLAAAVSGVVAYVVNRGRDNAAPALSVARQQPAKGQEPAAPPQDLEQFASSMQDHGVTLGTRRGGRPDVDGSAFRAAFLACRRHLPERRFGR